MQCGKCGGRSSQSRNEVATLNHYVRNAEAYAELANGRIDALVVSATYANEQAKTILNIRLSMILFPRSRHCSCCQTGLSRAN